MGEASVLMTVELVSTAFLTLAVDSVPEPIDMKNLSLLVKS